MKQFDFSRLNMYTVLRDIALNFWVIILAAVFGLFGGMTYFKFIRPERFTSTMTVSINLSGYTTSSTAVSLTKTVIIAETLDDVFQSDALKNVVSKELGGEMTGVITAKQLGETNLISVSVTDSTPKKAYDALVSVYNNYDKVTDFVFTNVLISVISNPQMPDAPSNYRSPVKVGLLAGFVCAALAAFLIAAVSFSRDTVKNTKDVENELGARLFGVVKNVGHGITAENGRLAVGNSAIDNDFAESFRKMAVKIESLGRTKGIKTLMVTSTAEDEGKTTTAVNIAESLAADGYRVLLCDCDLRKPAVHNFFPWMPKQDGTDLHKFISDGGHISDFISHDSKTGLYIMDNSTSCNNAPELLSGDKFRAILAALKEQFDFVVIDTPPCGEAADAEIVSSVCDAYIMVVRQDGVQIRDINDQINSLDKPYFAGCVLSNYHEFKKKNRSEGTPVRNYGAREE